jgi:hypothetical protein
MTMESLIAGTPTADISHTIKNVNAEALATTIPTIASCV